MTTTELPLCLLRTWDGQPLDGWLASRKHNGIRCQWTGTRFQTRSGAPLDVPLAWYRGMPQTPLDGELATPDDDLPRVLSLQRLGRRGRWRGVAFRPFDVPIVGPRVEERLRLLASLRLPAHCQPVQHVRIASEAMLDGFLTALEAAGAEGAVFRRPRSKYEHGRSWHWLKHRFGG